MVSSIMTLADKIFVMFQFLHSKIQESHYERFSIRKKTSFKCKLSLLNLKEIWHCVCMIKETAHLHFNKIFQCNSLTEKFINVNLKNRNRSHFFFIYTLFGYRHIEGAYGSYCYKAAN